jgi:hypothetical protein
MSNPVGQDTQLEGRAEETRTDLVQELGALRRRPAMVERRTKRTATTALIAVGIVVLFAVVATWLRRR